MKESHREGVASHPGPEPCEGGRKVALEALDRGIRRQGIELRNQSDSGCRRCQSKRKATRGRAPARVRTWPGGVGDPRHAEKLRAREPGDPVAARREDTAGRRENAKSGKSLMHGGGETYCGIVPTKQPNKGGEPSAEVAEGRPWTKENMFQPNPCRTPSRNRGPKELERVRGAGLCLDANHPR